MTSYRLFKMAATESKIYLRDMEGAQNSKSRSRNPLPDHFGPTFEFLSLAPLMFNIHAKFAVSSLNRSGDMEGSQNSKSRSRDPFPTALAYF